MNDHSTANDTGDHFQDPDDSGVKVGDEVCVTLGEPLICNTDLPYLAVVRAVWKDPSNVFQAVVEILRPAENNSVTWNKFIGCTFVTRPWTAGAGPIAALAPVDEKSGKVVIEYNDNVLHLAYLEEMDWLRANIKDENLRRQM